jgi:hypothetical protein
MTNDDAKAILIRAFVAAPDLPPDMQKLLAQLIVPPVKRAWWKLW